MSIRDKLKDCLKEGKKGERHKGLREIEPSMKVAQDHIHKAIHNFNAIDTFYNVRKINCIF